MNTHGTTRAALWAMTIALLQVANGSIETSFTPHLPAIGEHLRLGPGALGTVLAGLPAGLLVGSLLGGPLSKWLGSRPVLLAGGLLFFASLPFTVLSPTPGWLLTTLLVAGFGNGLFDTGWVLQSTSYAARRGGRQHHQRMSAMFSFGSIAGVLAAVMVLHQGVSALPHLTAVGLITVAVAVGLGRFFPSAPERDEVVREAEAEEDAEVAVTTVDAHRWTFAKLCIAAFVAFFPLGAAYSWSTPYLNELGAAAWVAPAGLVAYTASEGLGRMLAFRYSNRFSPTQIVVAGALTALAGALLVVLPGRIDLAVAGWGLVALGVSPAGPTWQTAAHNSSRAGNRQVRLGVLTSASYVGSMVGLPVVGWVAQASSLRVALGLVGVCALLLLAFARSAKAAAPLA